MSVKNLDKHNRWRHKTVAFQTIIIMTDSGKIMLVETNGGTTWRSVKVKLSYLVH